MIRALHDKLDRILLEATASKVEPLSRLISAFLDGLAAFQYPQEPQPGQTTQDSGYSRQGSPVQSDPSDFPQQLASSSPSPQTSLSPLFTDGRGRLYRLDGADFQSIKIER